MILGPNDVVQPDLLVVGPADGDRLREDGMHGPPNLVAEVISPGARELDLGKKRSRYAYGCVSDYRVVGPDARTLTQLTVTGENDRALGPRTERVQFAILPEAVLDLAEVCSSPSFRRRTSAMPSRSNERRHRFFRVATRCRRTHPRPESRCIASS